MDISRQRYNEKDTHSTSTITNETGSNFSSDSDKTSKSAQKKRKGKKTANKSFTPDYFSMYTPPWATMNFIYLDLIRQLSLESEIRNSITQMDKHYDHNYLRGLQKKKKFKEEQYCEKIKTKHKPIRCEDFEMSPQLLCFSCNQKTKCSSCGQTIQNREPETAVKEIKHCCKCIHGSCPTLNDHKHIPFSHCHCQKPSHTCHFLNHVCDSLNHESVDPPERERPYSCTIFRKAQNSLDSDPCSNKSDPNLDKLLIENSFSVDTCTTKNIKYSSTKNQPDSQVASKNVKKNSFENDCGIVPSFLGGTGDEGPKLQGKRSRKSCLPQSTAYFLPISSLTTDKPNWNLPRFNN